MIGLKINEIELGQKAYFQKTITETDVYLYSGITGDLNPAHINQVEAENSIFKGRIAHGMLTAGLISAVLGMKLPGPGTIYLKQDIKFTAPVKFGDTIKAEVEVIEIINERNRVKLKTECKNQNGQTVLIGIAEVMPPK
ncbi:MaoC family dehydratase [Oceanirhabdus seepicola]|uniref:MaoC family dehydratase n=1 Tax=Oceanirhabdus seepicola TaxID=2828781 RepID=A0A9J6P969_9CLOT|nr:MaoC family dehydratase [Oceanirhabdus seepicola]MCM1992409.1 MaoC family dehydratase [Oceanirhabdus seepicola]